MVKIISTARKIDRETIQKASDLLTSWGLKVELGQHLFAEHNQFAGTDEERAQDLQMAMDDRNCKAIFCARGGYGTVRLMDLLEYNGIKAQPKWVVGYSDVTVLHCHLQQALNIESLHATMPINFEGNSPLSLSLLKDVLFGKSLNYSIHSHPFNRKGNASGELVGGNLSILYGLNGSASFPDTKNRILFIEDLDEYLYHVDRMMMSLKRSGVFENLCGLIIGGMYDMNDNDIPFGKEAEEIIRDIASPYDFPISFGFPAGHLDDNRPLIMGRKIAFQVSEGGSEISFNS